MDDITLEMLEDALTMGVYASEVSPEYRDAYELFLHAEGTDYALELLAG